MMAIDCGGRIVVRAGRLGKNNKLNKRYLTLDSPVWDCSRCLLYQIHDNAVRRAGQYRLLGFLQVPPESGAVPWGRGTALNNPGNPGTAEYYEAQVNTYTMGD